MKIVSENLLSFLSTAKETNATLEKTDDIKNEFNKILFKTTSQNMSIDNDINLKNNIVVKKEIEDIILDYPEDKDIKDVFKKLEEAYSSLDDNDSSIIEKFSNIFSKDLSLDEIDEELSSLAYEIAGLFNINSTGKIEPNVNVTSSLDGVHIDNNLGLDISNNTQLLNIDDTASSSEDSALIEKLTDFLASESTTLSNEEKDTILNSLSKYLNSNGEIQETFSGEKKDIFSGIDNLNINVAHNIATFRGGEVESSYDAKINSGLLDKIVNKIEYHLSQTELNNETIKIRLKLYPSNLGDISIEIDNLGGKMNFKILTENNQTKSYLSSSINEMVSKLTTENVEVGNVSVFASSDNNQNNSQHNSRQNENKINNINNSLFMEDLEDDSRVVIREYTSSSKKLDLYI